MAAYAIDEHGKILPFENGEDAANWFESRGLGYEAFDHWPSSDEYFMAMESMECSAMQAKVDGEPGHEEPPTEVICDHAYRRPDCQCCLHRKPHKPFCTCSSEAKCLLIGENVTCIPCKGEVG